MNKPEISVILPVFNCEKYLSDCINSILLQTFEDFELIIINDGSNDSSLQIIENLSAQDSRIVVISRENKGLSATLNEGINASKGRWIARMDADDIALPRRFELQLKHLNKTGADICGGGIKRFGNAKRTVIYYEKDDAIKLHLCFNSPFAHPTIVAKSELLKAHMYDERMCDAEDYDLWTRIALSGASMTNLIDIVLLHRQHDQQVSILSQKKQIETRRVAQQRYILAMMTSQESFEIMTKFSTPYDTPSLDDAISLAHILRPINWASNEAKIQIFSNCMKYVRPSTVNVYLTALSFSKSLGRYIFINYPLLFQSLFRINPGSSVYNFLKQFV